MPWAKISLSKPTTITGIRLSAENAEGYLVFDSVAPPHPEWQEIPTDEGVWLLDPPRMVTTVCLQFQAKNPDLPIRLNTFSARLDH